MEYNGNLLILGFFSVVVGKGLFKIVKMFIDYGVKVNFFSLDRKILLFYVIRIGNCDIMKMFIDNKVRVNVL